MCLVCQCVCFIYRPTLENFSFNYFNLFSTHSQWIFILYGFIWFFLFFVLFHRFHVLCYRFNINSLVFYIYYFAKLRFNDLVKLPAAIFFNNIFSLMPVCSVVLRLLFLFFSLCSFHFSGCVCVCVEYVCFISLFIFDADVLKLLYSSVYLYSPIYTIHL